MNRKANQKALIEVGYQAALKGKPCIAPVLREADRAAWEQGWRAGRNARKKIPRGTHSGGQ